MPLSQLAQSRPPHRRSRTLGLALGLMLSVTACTPTVTVHGHVPAADSLAKINVGQTSRGEVAQIIGTPSTASLFRDDAWYYITETVEKTAFFRPEVKERRIVAILFSGNDRVADVVTYTEADGRDVEIVSRVTPTAGNEITILQQIFGNIGRFSSGPNQ